MNEETGFPKYQYSQFDQVEGQYVVRSNDKEEFKQLVAEVKMATGRAWKQTQAAQPVQSAAVASDKPKVPYMWEGDTCPVCHRGTLVKTMKETKDKQKYQALVCDQPNCYGKAYISKYPKKEFSAPAFNSPASSEVSDEDIPF